MTNNEGGTSDEEFRNVALVDRVNTTMAVWMGTTMACAQCHNHKYDPISQEDYFRLFAILNNTADADRGDESPVMPLFSHEQKRFKAATESEIGRLETILSRSTPELAKDQIVWESRVSKPLPWQTMMTSKVTSRAGAVMRSGNDGIVHAGRSGKTDSYIVELSSNDAQPVQALRLEVLPEDGTPTGRVGHADGHFVLTRVQARIVPDKPAVPKARHVRIELPGKERILSLAEVQIFQGDKNVAQSGEARQSSTAFEGPAKLAIDGNTNGDFNGARSTTHTETSSNPWWEVDLKQPVAIDRVTLWNRTDGSQERLSGFRVVLLDENRISRPRDSKRRWSSRIPIRARRAGRWLRS
jgi:hypothetical protein